MSSISTAKNPLYTLFEKSFLFEWLLAFILVIIARLPYLLSDHVYFDGDEAMLGVMGRDLITGQSLPFYFYGQRYGFSFFEALSVGIFIPFLGSGIASLKLGGMLLFSLGIQRYMKIFREKKFTFFSYLLIALILVLFPTWLIWGTKLRGGYLTAFVGLAFLVEQLLLYQNWKRKNQLIVFCVSVIVLVSQPFFIFPIVFWLLHRILNSYWKDTLFSLGIGALLFIFLRILSLFNVNFWHPSGFGTFNLDVLHKYCIEGFWSVFTGFFSYTYIYEVPHWSKVGSVVFSILAVSSIFYGLKKLNHTSKFELILLLIGTICSIFLVTFANGGGRYLLPFFTGYLIVLVFLVVRMNKPKIRFRNLALALGIASLLPTLTGFDKYKGCNVYSELNDMEMLLELVDKIQSKNVSHGFVGHWELNWQLNYLANGTIKFRQFFMKERGQDYIDAVNACYSDSLCSTVFVGYDMGNIPGCPQQTIRVNKRFILIENPNNQCLKAANFELPIK